MEGCIIATCNNVQKFRVSKIWLLFFILQAHIKLIKSGSKDIYDVKIYISNKCC